MSPKIRTVPRWTVTLTCDAPLHHGAFGSDTGNAVAFRRLPIVSAPQRAGIPVLSGNAVRGGMRRQLMRDLLTVCGLTRDGLDLEPAQWDKLYGAVANGGHLTGSEGRVSPDARLALRQAVPALSVLGAALYSYMLPGKISIGWAYPACTETVAAGYCAPVDGLRDADDLLTEISLTRHIDRDWQDPELSGVTPMPVTVEALIPGTVLTTVVMPMAGLSPEEEGAVAYGLTLLERIGGKTGIGFGRIRVTHDIDPAPYLAWREDAAAVGAARAALIQLAQASTSDLLKAKGKARRGVKAMATTASATAAAEEDEPDSADGLALGMP